MTTSQSNSPRRRELLEASYSYALGGGISELSLRPLADAIGSSPRVLLYLFGSKEGLIRALLARARMDELEQIEEVVDGRDEPEGLPSVARRLWRWLSGDARRGLAALWLESYARSVMEPGGPWSGFAHDTVNDWLGLLATGQPAERRDTQEALTERTLVLAVLRGALLDLLTTGDVERTTTAVHLQLERMEDSASR